MAENVVAGIFLADGWIVNPLKSDYGYDLLIEKLAIEGEASTTFGLSGPTFGFLQVKGTDKSLLEKAENSFSFTFDVKDLLYWKDTPIPVYVAIVELSRKNVFILDARDIARTLETRFGNSWSSCSTRNFDVPRGALHNSAKAAEIALEIKEYWEAIRLMWRDAESEPKRFRLPGSPADDDFLDMLHRQAVADALVFQSELTACLGSRDEMLILLKSAGLAEIRQAPAR